MPDLSGLYRRIASADCFSLTHTEYHISGGPRVETRRFPTGFTSLVQPHQARGDHHHDPPAKQHQQTQAVPVQVEFESKV
jgi:hypothetical protein